MNIWCMIIPLKMQFIHDSRLPKPIKLLKLNLNCTSQARYFNWVDYGEQWGRATVRRSDWNEWESQRGRVLGQAKWLYTVDLSFSTVFSWDDVSHNRQTQKWRRRKQRERGWGLERQLSKRQIWNMEGKRGGRVFSSVLKMNNTLDELHVLWNCEKKTKGRGKEENRWQKCMTLSSFCFSHICIQAVFSPCIVN